MLCLFNFSSVTLFVSTLNSVLRTVTSSGVQQFLLRWGNVRFKQLNHNQRERKETILGNRFFFLKGWP